MRTSFSIPEELLEEFDDVWRDEGFESRSRAVREAMQEYIERHNRLEEVSGEVTAAVAFDYEHKGIEELHDVQHSFQDIVTGTSHTHEGDWCVEVVFCRGDGERVRELVYRLRDFDAVRRVKVLLLTS